jgi:hypothetical protein
MAFNVRIFGHRGTRQLPVTNPMQMQADTVQVLEQPYEFSQVISVSAVAASSAADPSTKVQLLRIEVPDGQTVRYEINPPNRTTAASTNSPSLSGKDQFFFGTGWTVSLIDAAGLL